MIVSTAGQRAEPPENTPPRRVDSADDARQASVAESALDRPVALHPLTYLEEHGEVVIGRPDIDSYGVFPPDGAALVRQLAAGTPPAQAARWYADAYDEQVDLKDFIDTLRELHFLGGPGAAASQPLRWQRLGRWMFSPAAWLGYGLLIAAAVAAMAVRPRLAPHPGNLIFTHYMTVLELVLFLVLFLGQFPLILLHEAFHILAGRRLGLRSSLRVGRRLYYAVFETALDGLVAVPRRQRYLPMLAGMLSDLVVIAVLTLAADATMRPDGSIPLVGAICLALAYETLLRFAWQFFVYLRTDVYAVVVTVLGCMDLHAAAQCILANRVRSLLRRPRIDESVLHPRDRAAGRWYSWLMLAGYAFSIATVAVGAAPVTWRVLATVVGRLTAGGHPSSDIADSVIFLTLNLAQIIVILAFVLRSWRRRRHQPPNRRPA